MPRAGWQKLSVEEIRLAKLWHTQDHLKPSEIAARLKRDKSAITGLLVKQAPRSLATRGSTEVNISTSRHPGEALG